MIRTLALASALALAAPASAEFQCFGLPDGETYTWFVGQPVSDVAVLDPDTLYCYANGPELAVIANGFQNLHLVPGASVTSWHGEDAIFILDNLENIAPTANPPVPAKKR